MKFSSLAFAAAMIAGGIAARADDGARIVTLDHYVRVTSTAPAMAGQTGQIYVREKTQAGTVLRGKTAGNRVVLFVHGAGTPAEVAFDVPYQDYSWMAYLAAAGFDTFSMDMTGYGRSSRPAPMDTACNTAAEDQPLFAPNVIAAPCAATSAQPLTTIASDWNDIGAVVDHIRALRGVDKVALVGWSQGGPRTVGYTARNPQKVSRLVVLAPAYARSGLAEAPNPLPKPASPMSTQTRAAFDVNWDRQVGCAGQYDPAVSASVWSEMLASDPVGATWGPGVRRAPNVPSWGFNQAVAAKLATPVLMVSGVHDKQVPQERVREFYADLGAPQKVFIDLACSSHNAMWERNHLLLFKASLEWLTSGTVNGQNKGEMKLGYE